LLGRCEAKERRMFLWLKKWRLYPGKVVVRWPLKDVREDILIVDLSRLQEHLVGVRRRRYGVYRRSEPPPGYPAEVEFVDLSDL
jgi:hypothetical protein